MTLPTVEKLHVVQSACACCNLNPFQIVKMNSNFVGGAVALWEVAHSRVSACPLVSPEEAVQLLQPVVKVEEPLAGFRNSNHQVMKLSSF